MSQECLGQRSKGIVALVGAWYTLEGGYLGTVSTLG